MVERVDYYSDEEYAQALNQEQEEQQAYLEAQWEQAERQWFADEEEAEKLYHEEMKIEASIDAELDKQAGI